MSLLFLLILLSLLYFSFFFFNDTATTEIYTLSLHDALPISNETIGDGKLELPENEMHTTAYWVTLERPMLESLPFSVSERQSGMLGLLHALECVATLLLMCDRRDRKSTRLNSSHGYISYAVFCLKQ